MNLKQITILLLEAQAKMLLSVEELNKLRGVGNTASAEDFSPSTSSRKRVYRKPSKGFAPNFAIEATRSKALRLVEGSSCAKIARVTGVSYGQMWRLLKNRDGANGEGMKHLSVATMERINRLYETRFGNRVNTSDPLNAPIIPTQPNLSTFYK